MLAQTAPWGSLPALDIQHEFFIVLRKIDLIDINACSTRSANAPRLKFDKLTTLPTRGPDLPSSVLPVTSWVVYFLEL